MARFLWRAFIGPKLHHPDSPYFFDWSSLNKGSAALVESSNNALALTLSAGETTLYLANSHDSLPNKAGVWVGPNGSGQGWEYVEYTGKGASNSLFGGAREGSAVREHNGAHSPGAEVRFWMPLDGDNGVLKWSEGVGSKLSSGHWEGEIEGVNVPQAAMRNDHVIIVQHRSSLSASWAILLLGFTDSPRMIDDYQKHGRWRIYMKSSHNFLSGVQLTGVRAGELNMAPFGKAISSAPVGSAFKERHNGEYTAGEPDLTAGSGADGDLRTLWIGDRMIGGENKDDDYVGILSVHPAPFVGQLNAYKFIETTPIFGYLETYNTAHDSYQSLSVPELTSPDDKDVSLIFTSNAELFLREHPASETYRIINIANYPPEFIHGMHNLLNNLDAAGGAVAYKNWLGHYERVVIWGTQSGLPAAWAGSVGSASPLPRWSGAALPAPLPGQTIRRTHGTGGLNTAAGWNVSYISHPGYVVTEDADYIHWRKAWWQVILPGMGLYLRDDIAPGTTTIFVVNAAGEPMTNGLSASGSIRVGNSVISYTGKQADRITGTSVPASYSAGSAVLMCATTCGVDTYLYDKVRLHFSEAVYPTSFNFRYSMVPARDPRLDGYTFDYDGDYGVSYFVNDNTNTMWEVVFSPPVRAKTLLVEFNKMSQVPGRPRLREVEAFASPTTFDTSHWSASITTAQMLGKLLANAGVPAGAVNSSLSSPDVTGVTTASESAWSVLTDFADFVGHYLEVDRDSKLIVRTHPLWQNSPGSFPAPSYTFTRDTLTAVDMVKTRGNGVSQVRVEWVTPDGSDGGVIHYPESASWQGRVIDMGEMVYASAAAATLAARNRYHLFRYPYRAVYEIFDGHLNVRPLQIHTVQWDFDRSHGNMSRRFIALNVDHAVENMNHTTVVTGAQVDREVDW